MSERIRIKDLVGFYFESNVYIYEECNDSNVLEGPCIKDIYSGKFGDIPARLINREILVMYPDIRLEDFEAVFNIQII